MRKLTATEAAKRIERYFASRLIPKRDREGEVLCTKSGEILTEERPCTVTGLTLALGFTSREELSAVSDKKVKALVDRALLKIEESAEEKLFQKDSFQGTRLFLATNFRRWQEHGEEAEPCDFGGVFSEWTL